MIKDYLYIMKLTLLKTSLNRIFQQIFSKNITLDGKIIEFGANKNSSKSFINFLKISNKENVFFADKQDVQNGDTTIEDLETRLSFKDNSYNNVVIFNVLEHVYNVDNAIKEIYRSLEVEGKIVGSTPFIHRIHYAPEDYNRYSEQFLSKILFKNNFKNISVEAFGYGPFTAAYAMIFDYTKLIPLLNNLILTICILIDKFIGLFTKTDLKKIYPISICFSAKKG
jgi:SAM-dependent methyltransferase